MSLGSILALIVLVIVAGIVLFQVGATLMYGARRFRNWRLDGYSMEPFRIRENVGGIILALVMIALILSAHRFSQGG